MAVTITISGVDYQIPTQSQDAPWGEEVVSYLEALGEVANNQIGEGDILTTTFTPANNQSSAANITGLSFDTSSVRGAIVEYSIYRNTSTTEYSETGTLYLSFKSVAGTWDITRQFGGSSGMELSITNGGQVQYTSDNMGGTGYTARMSFRARSFVQS